MSSLLVSNLTRHGDHATVNLGFPQPFEVVSGEICVLAGKPGAGKTLLARLITGLERCDSGEIELGGRDLTHLPPHKRRIGYICQGDTLWPHWTLGQNIGFPLRCQGFRGKRLKARVDEIVSGSTLEGFMERNPIQVSPDLQDQAILMRALALEPDLLIIDEPFDPMRTVAGKEDQMRQLIVSQKITGLVLTRNFQAALKLGDKVGYFASGHLLQLGTAEELYARSASAEIAQEFGPINRIDGVIDSLNGRGNASVRTVLGLMTGKLQGPGPFSLGSAVTLLFRPEGLMPATATFGTHRFSACVQNRRQEGPLVRLELLGPEGWRGVSLIISGQASSLRVGHNMPFSVSSDFVSVIPHQPGSGS